MQIVYFKNVPETFFPSDNVAIGNLKLSEMYHPAISHEQRTTLKKYLNRNGHEKSLEITVESIALPLEDEIFEENLR